MEEEYGTARGMSAGNILFLGFIIYALLQLSRRGVLAALFWLGVAVMLVIAGFAAANWDIVDSLVAGAF